MKPFYVIILITGAALLSACGGGSSNAGQPAATSSTINANAARTNVEELSMSVNVPYPIDDLVWKEFPAEKRIIAVMRVDPADSARIVSEASANGPAQTVAIPTQKWFPDELIAQAQMSGDNTLRGEAYGANAFFQQPYTTGRIIHIEGTDYFVLDVSGK
jgi:hypothetical protein